MAHCTALLLLASLYTTVSFAAPYNNDRPTATLDSGVIAGVTTSLPSSTVTVNKFLGVPFAAPPVRFSPPRPPAPWQGVHDASAYGPACIQQFSYPEASRNLTIQWFNTPGPPAGESEDCLTVNVYAPASSGQPHGGWGDWKAGKGGKAVMFWIYGGGLEFGTNSLDTYDGSALVTNQDVIVVTTNYRTNVFGFPGTDELADGKKNLGWLDQRLALDWVQRNIAAFGGDPAKVTIFGESAGASSVDALLTAPPSPLPFRAAILESGQATVRAAPDDYTAAWNELAEAVGCSSPDDRLSCMRSIPAATLKDTEERLASDFSPVPDDVTLSRNARAARLSSTPSMPNIARVPILIGSNAEEGRIYALGQTDVAAYLRNTLPGANDSVIQLIANAYGPNSQGIAPSSGASAAPAALGPAFPRIAQIITELTFQCPAKLVAEDSAAVGIPTWRYYYNASFPNTQLFPGAGVFHSSEIPIVYDTYPREGATAWEAEASEGIQNVWGAFARDPGAGVQGWAPVPQQIGVLGGGARAQRGSSDRGDGVVVRAAGVDTVQRLDARCVLWDAVYDARSGG